MAIRDTFLPKKAYLSGRIEHTSKALLCFCLFRSNVYFQRKNNTVNFLNLKIHQLICPKSTI